MTSQRFVSPNVTGSAPSACENGRCVRLLGAGYLPVGGCPRTQRAGTAARIRQRRAQMAHDGGQERSTLELLLCIAEETKHRLVKEIELARIEIVEALTARAMAVAAFAVAALRGVFVRRFGARAAAA